MTHRLLAATWLLVLCARAAGAQSFAADLIASRPGSATTDPVGRIYVSSGQSRIETRELPDAFFVVNEAARSALFVRPKLRVFMDAKRSSPLTQIFVRVDAGDACAQWQTMEAIAGPAGGADRWQCERRGTDVIDGRELLKYEIVSGANRRSQRWVDPRLDFPVRVETDEGTVIALGPIAEAPQADALFAVPSGYRKFDPLQLIEQIKMSDVWVEPSRK